MSAAKETPRRRVFIVDDHAVVRQGLTKLIDQEKDLRVCGEADGAGAALERVRAASPDVAVVDISLASSSGLDLIKSLRTLMPRLPIIVFSMHEEDYYAERAVRAGASGYVMKSEDPSVLIAALRKAIKGKLHLSPKMTERILEKALGGTAGGEDELSALSDREFQVFSLIGKGIASRDISRELNLSVKTIEAVKENLKRKLGLPNAAELNRYAIEAGRDLEAKEGSS